MARSSASPTTERGNKCQAWRQPRYGFHTGSRIQTGQTGASTTEANVIGRSLRGRCSGAAVGGAQMVELVEGLGHVLLRSPRHACELDQGSAAHRG
jgi:hypothetical protein